MLAPRTTGGGAAATDADPARLVYLETFGCQMNELDSELVTSSLRALGYRFTADLHRAGIVLYNTCSVREAAEQKVYSRLGLLRDRKRRRPETIVGVLGCMAERDGTDLLRRFPQVDVMCGPGELDKLPLLLDNARKTAAPAIALQGNTSRRSATLAAAEDSLELLDLSRSFAADDQRGGGRSAYVRITRGCNKFCTYCVVPFTRGAEIHRPPQHIVDECKRLVSAGVVEITLLGQTVNHYRFEHDAAATIDGVAQPQKGRSFTGGHDRDPLAGGNVTTFADLLRRVHDEVPGLRRLRFVTSYPRDFGDDVLEAMRDCPRVCRYLHVPVQSGSNRILAKMNRGYTVEEYRDFIDRIRVYLPDATIASDVIVGFPTETEEDFEATAALLRWARFKNCFIFKYSPRPGTPAFDRMTDDVPEEVKRRRNNALLAVQAAISREIHAAQIGKTLEVFVEGASATETRKRQRRTAGAAMLESAMAVVGVADANGANGSVGGRVGVVGLTINGQRWDAVDGLLTDQGVENGAHCHDGNGYVGDDAIGACASGNGHVVGVDVADDAATADPDAVVQLSGRTDGDLIAVFDAPASAAASLVGTIVPVRIEASQTLTLKGRPIGG